MYLMKRFIITIIIVLAAAILFHIFSTHIHKQKTNKIVVPHSKYAKY
jgi:hypothetical protein